MLTVEQQQILIAELANDPEARGYAAMTADAVAADLNAPRDIIYGEVEITAVNRELIMMSDSQGRFAWDNVLDAANDAGHASHDLARRLKFLFDGRLPINWGGANAEALLALSVQAGFFTAAQAQTLKDTGKRVISRAEQLGLPHVRVGYVLEARG